MGFNSVFKGLKYYVLTVMCAFKSYTSHRHYSGKNIKEQDP